MALHFVISLLVGFLVTWLADMLLVSRPNGHRFAVILGVLVGILVYIGAISL